MNIFSPNSWLGRFMNFLADLIIVHFLWLICSIPIITIGASTTALYYSLMKRQRRDEGYVYTNFLKSFKANFRQSTIIWLILLGIGLVLGMDFRIGMLVSGTLGKLMIFGSVLLMIPYLFVLTYIFPVQAKFENKIVDNLKNALFMAIAHFGYTLLLFLFFIVFLVLGVFSPTMLGIVLLGGAGIYGYLTSNIFIMVFRKHLPEELAEDMDAIGMR